MKKRWRIGVGMALLLVAVSIGIWRVWLTAPEYAGAHLSVAEAHSGARDGDVLLVDIRRPDEWQRTGVPDGAVPIDMRRDDFITELATLTGPDRSRAVALICARGVRSARLAQRLTDAGFSTIIDVPEGMLGSSAGPGWLRTGLPTHPPSGETE